MKIEKDARARTEAHRDTPRKRNVATTLTEFFCIQSNLRRSSLYLINLTLKYLKLFQVLTPKQFYKASLLQ